MNSQNQNRPDYAEIRFKCLITYGVILITLQNMCSSFLNNKQLKPKESMESFSDISMGNVLDRLDRKYVVLIIKWDYYVSCFLSRLY